MKSLISVLVLSLAGLVIAGCEASASVGDNDDHDRRIEKTTVTHPDGDRTVRKEVYRED